MKVRGIVGYFQGDIVIHTMDDNNKALEYKKGKVIWTDCEDEESLKRMEIVAKLGLKQVKEGRFDVFFADDGSISHTVI